MNQFPKILSVGMVIIVAIWLLFSHNEPEPDNHLSAAERLLADRPPIDEASVAEWQRYQLPREEPIPRLPD